MIKNLSIFILVLGMFAGLAFGQATMSSTTTGAAVSLTTTRITVASSVGILAPTGNQTVSTILFIDKEAMSVASVESATLVVVVRGYNSRPTSHANGATVYFGTPALFSRFDPAGSCTSALEVVLPKIVIPTGNVWNCVASAWVPLTSTEFVTDRHVGTAATGVTAVEYGTDRSHVTKLTFSAQALAPATTNASVGMGKLLYTLPAGAVIVKSAYMSVALDGSGAADDADTPDVGLGTVIATGAVAVLGGTGTFEDMLTGQTAADCNGTATLAMVSGQVLNIPAASAHTVHLNAADGFAGIATISATGTVVLEWTFVQ